MMEAVLVIDMPDGVSLDEWYAVTVVVDRLIATEDELKQGIPFDESKTFKFVPLRPLPKEEEPTDEVVELGSYNEGYGNGYECGFADGWNACLKEITK